MRPEVYIFSSSLRPIKKRPILLRLDRLEINHNLNKRKEILSNSNERKNIRSLIFIKVRIK